VAFTQEQLDSIEAAIAEGALTVQYQDKRVTYRSLEEMWAIRGRIRKALGLDPRGIIAGTHRYQPFRDHPGELKCRDYPPC
jgi:hypothetical protein